MAADADRLTVRTHDNVSVDFATAGIGSRFLALWIDNIIFVPIGIIVGFATGALLSLFVPQGGSSTDTQISAYFSTVAPILTVLAAYTLYFIISEGLSAGRTPGKVAVGIRVVRTDGSAIGMSEAALRGLTKSPLLALLDFLLGPIVMFLNPQSRRIGDLFAGTVVIRERAPATSLANVMPAPVYLHIQDPGPAISGVERLGPRELSALRTLLSRPDLHPVQRQRVATDMAHKLLERLGLPGDAPERMESPELLVERIYLQMAQQAQ